MKPLALALLLCALNAHALSGNDILNDCPAALGSADDLDVEQLLNGTNCMGYVSGLNDMVPLISGLANTRVYCPPQGGLDTGDAVRLFLKWLAAHPEQLAESARTLFISAMTQSFPCT